MFTRIRQALTAERLKLIAQFKTQMFAGTMDFCAYEKAMLLYAWAVSREFVCGSVLGIGAVIALAGSILGWLVTGAFDPIEQYTLIVSAALIIYSG